MAMETRLSLRQSQRVVMTPLLQQAIQLLQLSTLELQEVVQKELLENPLLSFVERHPSSPSPSCDRPVRSIGPLSISPVAACSPGRPPLHPGRPAVP